MKNKIKSAALENYFILYIFGLLFARNQREQK